MESSPAPHRRLYGDLCYLQPGLSAALVAHADEAWHDERRRRFFAYLNLFIAAMLTLVLASDYLVMFLGWEGVGLAYRFCSPSTRYGKSRAATA